MKELNKLLKSLVIVIVVALTPITIVITIKLHQQHQADNDNRGQQNATILLSEIENHYTNLADMLEFVRVNYHYPALDKIPKENLEKSAYLFIRSGIDKNNLSGQFAWSFITQRYEILHRNINRYNRKVTNNSYKIKNIDDVPRVTGRYKGGIE